MTSAEKSGKSETADPRSSSKLLLAAAVCVGVLAALGLYAVWHSENDARLDAGRSLQAVSATKARQIAVWRSERLADAKLLMDSPYLVTAVAQWLTHPSPADTDTMRQRLLASKENRGYADVSIVDGSGNILLSTSGSTGRAHEEVRVVLDQAVREKKPVLLGLHAGPDGSDIHLGGLAPLDLTGTPAAGLRAAVVLQMSAKHSIVPVLASWPYPSESSEMIMVRRDGDTVLYLTDLRFQSGTAMKMRIPLSRTDVPAVQAVLGTTGVITGSDYRGVDVFAALTRVEDSPWFLVAKVDRSEAMALWRTRAVLIVGLIVSGAAAAFAAMLWMRSRAITMGYEATQSANRARRDMEEQFHSMSASAKDAIIMMDNEGRATFFSDAAEKMFGRTREAALGTDVHNLICPAKYRPMWEAAREHWQKTGQGDAVGKTLELTAARADGTEFPIEMSLSSPNIDGRWSALAIIRDVTERKASERALRESEERLKALFETSNDALMLLDEKGFFDCNPKTLEIFGIAEKEQFTRLSPAELSPPSQPDGQGSVDAAAARIKTALDNGHERFEWVHRRADGTDFPAEVLLSAFDSQGRRVLQASVRDITTKKRAEAEIKNANDRLSAMVRELDLRSRQTRSLAEIREFLAGCASSEEIGPVVAHGMQNLLPDSAGALFLLKVSKTDLECSARWGAHSPGADEDLFAPDACWGLRRGGVYVVEDTATGIVCPHVTAQPARCYACVPLMAKGDVLGVLHVQLNLLGREAEAASAALKELCRTLAEILSLSISNIRLSEKLRSQSIRDPLTNLHNRRFMEESFAREIVRAQRKKTPIGVVMVDVDHFKRFNDTFGHAAGDVVLAEVAKYLALHVRGSDVVSRYGGEEFALILPESRLQDTVNRATQLVDGVRALAIQCNGQMLGKVTVSMGVSTYPEHGSTADELLRAADAALYRAKKEGRDRVVST